MLAVGRRIILVDVLAFNMLVDGKNLIEKICAF
jgi:hypothetical protein